ncbi:MAG: glycosyltransferase family 1 protein [Chloroflexota bacterium]|nr:MAG: glycosyltransferase family 1 protein [Chloroflexota bacterium]
MRILLMPSSFPPVLGGLQTVVHTLAKHLPASGHDVLVVTNRYPRSLPGQEIIDGVRVYRWHFLSPHLEDLIRRRPDLFMASLYFCPSVFLRLYQLMRTYRPEVINIHFPDAQVPFVLWLKRCFEFRLVVSLHGHDIERWFETGRSTSALPPHDATGLRPGRNSLRSLLRQADAVTACSRNLLEQAIRLESSVGEKGHVVHNGIDLDRFKDSTYFQHPRPYILSLGRLCRQKGFDMLLDAFARVAPNHPGIDLLIAGDGEEREALQAQARRLGLAGRVSFFGRATPDEVVQLLNACLFVAVPSRLESFGIVALEALAAGKVVLATLVGGLPEFLTGSSNLLVEPKVNSLADGLRRLLERRTELELTGRRNRERATSLTWARAVEKYLTAYCGD